MGATTEISWTDATFNPWRGCTKVAPGCANCYAEREAKRFPANRGIWGPNGTRVRASDAMWKEPLKWDRAAAERMAKFRPDQRDGVARPRVFCASLADVFEDWQGEIVDHQGFHLGVCGSCGIVRQCDEEVCSRCMSIGCRSARMDDLRRDLFTLIDATPHLDWLLLTKRPENISKMWPENVAAWEEFKSAGTSHCKPRSSHETSRLFRRNAWLGCSVSDQATADAMLPELLKCRDLSPVLFASYEPALGPVNLREYLEPMHWEGQVAADEWLHRDDCPCRATGFMPRLDWLIVGGESGHNARPFDIAWARSAIEQCKAAGVPCFVKQLGAKPLACASLVTPNLSGGTGRNMVPWKITDKKGGDISEFPEDLRVREFPTTPALVVPR